MLFSLFNINFISTIEMNNVSQTTLLEQNKINFVGNSKIKNSNLKIRENLNPVYVQHINTEDSNKSNLNPINSKIIKDLKNWRTNWASKKESNSSNSYANNLSKLSTQHNHNNICSTIPVEK